MVFCPACKTELENGTTTCYVCGYDLTGDTDAKWVVIGIIENNISADFAREALESYNIPAVIISKSGFFGHIGLPLTPLYGRATAHFEVSVPVGFEEDADNILKMVIGKRWHREEP